MRLAPGGALQGPFNFVLQPGKTFTPRLTAIGGAPHGLRFDVVDLDADGFLSTADCNDTDPAINPDAAELPGNLVDENCDAQLACSPDASYGNHGAFVSCVSRAAEALYEAGRISEAQKNALIEQAAQSNVGKK